MRAAHAWGPSRRRSVREYASFSTGSLTHAPVRSCIVAAVSKGEGGFCSRCTPIVQWPASTAARSSHSLQASRSSTRSAVSPSRPNGARPAARSTQGPALPDGSYDSGSSRDGWLRQAATATRRTRRVAPTAALLVERRLLVRRRLFVRRRLRPAVERPATRDVRGDVRQLRQDRERAVPAVRAQSRSTAATASRAAARLPPRTPAARRDCPHRADNSRVSAR